MATAARWSVLSGRLRTGLNRVRNGMHTNFYEEYLHSSGVRGGIDDATALRRPQKSRARFSDGASSAGCGQGSDD